MQIVAFVCFFDKQVSVNPALSVLFFLGIKEIYFTSGVFRCEFNCGMEFIGPFYKVVQYFFSMLPYEEYIVNIADPYYRLQSLCIEEFLLQVPHKEICIGWS